MVNLKSLMNLLFSTKCLCLFPGFGFFFSFFSGMKPKFSRKATSFIHCSSSVYKVLFCFVLLFKDLGKLLNICKSSFLFLDIYDL